MQAQYEHSPPTSSCSTIAAVRPPWTTRSATFSPTGPAPMTTTSTVLSVMSVRLRGEAVQADRGDQEEHAAQDRIARDGGEGGFRPAGHHDETAAGEHRDAAAQDHR